jgi:hypothetical protein
MTEEPGAWRDKLSLREALDDVGWFWLTFASAVGAPSILALLQMVFVEHRLIDALQWIVDGYNDILARLSREVEPFLRAALDWLGSLFSVRFDLQPHWRPVFILAMLLPTSIGRTMWSDEKYVRAIVVAAPLMLAALMAAIVVGVMPLEGSRLSQGFAAGLPIFLLMFVAGLVTMQLEGKGQRHFWDVLGINLLSSLIFGGVAFVMGVAAYEVLPGVGRGGGLIGLAYCVFMVSIPIMIGDYDRTQFRVRITLFGAFLTALAIIAADALIKLLSAAS